MHIELSDLKVFSTVVEQGGISAAARQLHCVPSNVSARIRLLEARLGVPLFRRQNRRLVLLPEGRELLGYAGRILGLVEEAEDALLAQEPRGLLRLGATECATVGYLPQPLATFQRTHPACQVQLVSGNTRDLLQRLGEGDLEAALVVDGETGAILERRPRVTETLVWITHKEARQITKAEDMGQVVLLAFARGCAYRDRAERWFARQRAAPAHVMEIQNYHVLLACVAAGMGVALVPASLVAASAAHGQVRCHPLRRVEARAPLSLYFRRGPLNLRLQALLDCLPR